MARTVERTFSPQLASEGTARLLSHLAGARQMSAGVKLARCHSGREGQNLFQKCAKSWKKNKGSTWNVQINTAYTCLIMFLTLMQTFPHHPSHLQPCSSLRLTRPRQWQRQGGGPAQLRVGKKETRSTEMLQRQEPVLQSVEMLKKDKELREQGNPASQSQARDARTQVRWLEWGQDVSKVQIHEQTWKSSCSLFMWKILCCVYKNAIYLNICWVRFEAILGLK